jgi:hypothetical protein
MGDKRKTVRIVSILPRISALILAVALVASCKGPILSNGSGGVSDLSLSFRVLGASKSSAVPASKSVSPLVLPSASSLTVSLTPLDSGLSTPAPQVVSIPSSSGAQVISASFTAVEWGNYTVKAVASDKDGTPRFQRSVALALSEPAVATTLDLLPVIGADSPNYVENYFSINSLPAKAALSGKVPSDTSMYGICTLYFSLDSSVGFKFYLQDAEGALLASGDVDTSGYITTKDVTAVPEIQFTLPAYSVCYLTLFNPYATDASYINATVSAYNP